MTCRNTISRVVDIDTTHLVHHNTLLSSMVYFLGATTFAVAFCLDFVPEKKNEVFGFLFSKTHSSCHY